MKKSCMTGNYDFMVSIRLSELPQNIPGAYSSYELVIVICNDHVVSPPNVSIIFTCFSGNVLCLQSMLLDEYSL